MALKKCPECSHDVSENAHTCPSCGQPLHPTTKRKSASNPNNIGCGLGLGIIFMPLIFSWFTLREGFSTTTRVVAFGYMILTLFLGIGAFAAAPDEDIAPQVTNVASPTPTGASPNNQSSKDEKPEKAKQAQADQGAPTISDGVYAVGSEFEPGVYRVGKYWATQDKNQNTIKNDITKDCPTIAVVKPSDAYIKIQGGAVDATKTTVDPIEKECTSGTFLVGVDIEPGRYKLESNSTGYWSRLNSNLGTIANDIGEGQLIVVVRKSDFALKIQGGTLEKM